MKVVQSPDGSVKVVELDPTKAHVIIIDDDAIVDPEHLSLRDGAIWYRRPKGKITILETPRESIENIVVKASV